MNYLKMLVEDIHSATVATICEDGYPQTRIIDMMLYDNEGVYFLTAKGKVFYKQLMEQKFIALSAVKGKISVTLRGKIENIGSSRLDEIFEKNPYMRGIYPDDTRSALEVFRIYQAAGEFFDISEPTNIVRESFVIGNPETSANGYFITENCTGCGKCAEKCPQRCVDTSSVPAVINQNHCLHCGLCAEVCSIKAVKRS